ncbi:hypothetical protein AcW1_009418 [Taiwanofungus camphoratus]|nr:hypothetical protein AcW1_009418 [Antrodia cinnamomea]
MPYKQFVNGNTVKPASDQSAFLSTSISTEARALANGRPQIQACFLIQAQRAEKNVTSDRPRGKSQV